MINSVKTDAQDDLAQLQASAQVKASWQQAQRSLLKGRHGPALASYRNLVRQFPGVSQLWAELGVAAAGELDFALANEASQRAAELAFANAEMLVSIGEQYQRLRRTEKSCACFQRAVAADPASVEARLSLAGWFERHRRLQEAWDCVQACLSHHPKDGRARYFKAFLLHRKGLHDEAEAALRDLLKSTPRSTRL